MSNTLRARCIEVLQGSYGPHMTHAANCIREAMGMPIDQALRQAILNTQTEAVRYVATRVPVAWRWKVTGNRWRYVDGPLPPVDAHGLEMEAVYL